MPVTVIVALHVPDVAAVRVTVEEQVSDADVAAMAAASAAAALG